MNININWPASWAGHRCDGYQQKDHVVKLHHQLVPQLHNVMKHNKKYTIITSDKIIKGYINVEVNVYTNYTYFKTTKV